MPNDTVITPPIPWPTPRAVPFGSPREPFPLQALSPLHAEFVQSIAAATNVPVDVPAMLSLAAISAAAAKKAVVSIGFDGTIPLALWILVALRSGEGKSPAIEEVSRPLELAEQRLVQNSKADVAAREIRRRVLTRRLHHLEGLAGRTADEAQREMRLHEAVEVEGQLRDLSTAAVPKLIIGDTTTEGLTSRLAEQQGRLALLSDEGGELFGGIRRRAVGGVDYIEPLLKAYSGSALRIDRKGAGSTLVRDPSLTIGVAVQPAVLHELVGQHGGKGRGFLERFLFSVPIPLATRSQASAGVDDEARRDYSTSIYRLLEMPVLDRDVAGGAAPPTLAIQGDALVLMQSFSEEIDRRSRGDGDLADLFEWASKLRGNVARLAGILHLYDHPTEIRPDCMTCLPSEVVERAIAIGRYCIAHAHAAYNVSRETSEADRQVVFGWLRRHGQPVVRRRDVARGLHRRFSPASLDRVLDELVEDGLLRRAPQDRSGSGPRATLLEVHPSILPPPAVPG